MSWKSNVEKTQKGMINKKLWKNMATIIYPWLAVNWKKLNAEIYVPHNWFMMNLIDEIELQNSENNNKSQNWKFTQFFKLILCPHLETISKEVQLQIGFLYSITEFVEMVLYPHWDNSKKLL